MVSPNTESVKGFPGFQRDKAVIPRDTMKDTFSIISSLLCRRPPVLFLKFWTEDPEIVVNKLAASKYSKNLIPKFCHKSCKKVFLH